MRLHCLPKEFFYGEQASGIHEANMATSKGVVDDHISSQLHIACGMQAVIGA